MNHGKTHGKMVRHLMKHINIREEKTCMKFDVTHGKKRWKKRWKKLEKNMPRISKNDETSENKHWKIISRKHVCK